jgi:cyclic pyranopterin phosphate synthase
MSISISPADQPRKRTLVDGFFRTVTYLRLSVTDRCDLRCLYCMSPDMTFLPKKELLTLEELDRVCSAFIALGVQKLRLTGGEPLMRRGFLDLVRNLSRHLKSGDLQELTLTTNGTQLAKYAADLVAFGVRRINVSLDALDPDVFKTITRGGDIAIVLEGIAAARAAGLKVKINAVALRDLNEAALESLVEWSHAKGMDITLIETMPLGDTGEDRTDRYVPLSRVRSRFDKRYTLVDLPDTTGGPARYVRIAETGGRLGFITPLTHNFCETCNRVRVSCNGTLFMCLGKDDRVDLRQAVRASSSDELLHEKIDIAMRRKPLGHDFIIDRRGQSPTLARHMSVTGG